MTTNSTTTEDLSTLRLGELQQRFKAAIGEPTRCPNRKYLVRRIQEAEGASASSAPKRARREAKRAATPARARRKVGPMMVLPVRLEASVVRRLDAAWKRQGLRSRMDLFRQALQAFLGHAGEREVAALFATAAKD